MKKVYFDASGGGGASGGRSRRYIASDSYNLAALRARAARA